MTRIAVVEPHRVVREGLVRVLADEPDLEIVAAIDASGELEDALDGEPQPDVIVLAPSAAAPEVELAALATLAARGARVVALLSDPHPRDVRIAVESGARGVLAKTAGPEELVEAIRIVAAGGTAASTELVAPLGGGADDPLGDLSHREREVLRLIALGHTTPEIASLLDISTRTVESHRHHILVKLDLRTRADLVRYALRRGLIGPGG